MLKKMEGDCTKWCIYYVKDRRLHEQHCLETVSCEQLNC
jgi:hypothetical protein